MSAALRAAPAVVALAGLGIAGYLTVVHYTGGAGVRDRPRLRDRAAVRVRRARRRPGGAARPARLRRDPRHARCATASARGRDRVPRARRAGFSAWLTYVEVARLDAICIWCVGSAVCMALLAGRDRARAQRAGAAPPARA